MWCRAFLLSGLACLGILAAGCGGSKAPSVADIGTTTGATGASGAGRGSPGSGSSTAKDAAYARCMRSHGVTSFPDPSTTSAITPLPATIDPASPLYKSAEKACGALFPGFTQAQEAAAAGRWLPYAACIRAHGFPNFPDPTGNFVVIPPGIDPKSPLFEQAATTCRKLKPKTPLAP